MRRLKVEMVMFEVMLTPSLFCLLNMGLLAVSTCNITAFNNARTFDALRKVESDGSICKVKGDKLGPYQISKQYYNDSGIGDFGKGWQYVWGKGSKSYSEMIIKSYVCKHRRSNNLVPTSVALIHRFGTVNLSSVDAQRFKNKVTSLITRDVISFSSSTNNCEPECNLGQCCQRRKCMCLNTTTLEVKECKSAPDQVPNVLVDTDSTASTEHIVTLTLSWGEPFNNFDPIVNYIVSCSGDVTCPPDNTTTDNTTRSYTITNLTSMTNYTFSVVGTNSIGSGEAGVVMITTPSCPAMVGNIMIDLTTVNIDNNNVNFTLNWDEPFANFDPIVNYTITINCNDASCPVMFTVTTTSASVSFITDLSMMTPLSVTATNTICASDPTTIVINVPRDVGKVNLTCAPVDFINQCSVTWNALVNDPSIVAVPITYTVYYSGDNIISGSIPDINVTMATIILPAVDSDVNVFVIAMNMFGSGPASSVVVDEILAPSVTDATAALNTDYISSLHSIIVNCTVHPNSKADICEVNATAYGHTVTGTAPITNGTATVTVDGLMCEIMYTIISGGIFNGQLVGPRSFHGIVTAGPCPPIMTTTIATTSKNVTPVIPTSTPASILPHGGDA